MKRIVYLVLKQDPNAFHVLESIKKEGYNATIVATESLRHMVEEPMEERHFFSLRHLEQMSLQESVLCLFVVNEEKLEALKNAIREGTDHFKAIKGFMFSRLVEDYEGSI